MSDKMSNYNSILEAFQTLSLENETKFPDTKHGSDMLQDPNGTHDLPCRTPQTAGDMDNSDDTDMNSDVIVVDSSSASSDVSFFLTSNSISSSESVLEVDQWDYSDTETIPETESDSNINGSEKSCIMSNTVSTPIKRKYDNCLNKKERKSGRLSRPKLGADVDASPVLKPNVTTTRSGRAVRARIDNKFDYSSEPQDVDSDDSDDPDFGDNEFEDDDDDDEEYIQDNQGEHARKQRRISVRNSCCSSDAGSLLESDALIYLDLSRPVAIVMSEPTTEESVEFDSELKIRLQKFLGLVARQRRLYNPMSNFEHEDDYMEKDDASPPLRSCLWSPNNNVQPLSTPIVPAKPNPKASRLTSLSSNLTNEMKMLLIDDMVQRANANYFESQTPEHIKEPIDLSGLPIEEQRSLICQQHKKIASMIGPHVGLYNFVDSLRSTTPLNMCHPLAVNYRKRDFGGCKEHLAMTLFHILNHQIFHCGLSPEIVWRSCMNSPSSTEHRIEAGGQRKSRIILWQNMKHPGMMIKELLHEMCHAAAFVYHGETGHGDNCRKWAYRAKSMLPELPEIVDCNASYKYTCLLCRARSFGRIKFEDEAQQLRCHYCQFEVNVESCSDDIYNLSITDQLVTPYKEFVRANYGKCEQSGHSAKMRALNVLYREHQQQLSSN